MDGEGTGVSIQEDEVRRLRERVEVLRGGVAVSAIDESVRTRALTVLDRLTTVVSGCPPESGLWLIKKVDSSLEMIPKRLSTNSPIRLIEDIREINSALLHVLPQYVAGSHGESDSAFVSELEEENHQLGLLALAQGFTQPEPSEESLALAAGFTARLDALIDLLSAADVSVEVGDISKGVLARLRALATEFPEMVNPDGIQFFNLSDRVDFQLDMIPDALRDADETKLLRILRDLNASVGSTIRGRDGATPEILVKLLLEIGRENQDLAVTIAQRQILHRATTAISKAETAARLAEEAAGISGSSSLSEHFEQYARAERRSAELFRWLTVASIGGAVGVALLLPHPATGDWVGLIYRVLITTGVAALATYFGRQASTHNRSAGWAQSIKVQLQSFPAFIAPIPDGSTRNAIVKAFAARVLGSPPINTRRDEPAVSSSQIAELLGGIAKRV